jgi:hypothetical protein
LATLLFLSLLGDDAGLPAVPFELQPKSALDALQGFAYLIRVVDVHGLQVGRALQIGGGLAGKTLPEIRQRKVVRSGVVRAGLNCRGKVGPGGTHIARKVPMHSAAV